METNTPLGTTNSQTSEKKCPHCGKWTKWKLQAEDVCEHCGQLLSTHIQEKHERGEKIKNAPTGLFPIQTTDKPIVKFGKYSINFGHMLFTAFMSFVVWLITFIAG